MILEVRNLGKYYKLGFFKNKKIRAVENINFTVNEGEILGIIGQSGSGKSTIAKLITRLIKNNSGEIFFYEKNIFDLKEKEFRKLRKEIQLIFQQPQDALNPRATIYNSILEPVKIFKIEKDKETLKKKIFELLEKLGLEKSILERYPHEISGGQAQRVFILRTLLLNPKLIIADEPTNMLDVSVQAKILRILKSLVEKDNMSMIFISHDLEIINFMCDRVIVLENGKIVESGMTEEVFKNPQNEYTKKLLSSKL